MSEQNTERYEDSALELSASVMAAHVVVVHGSSSGAVREVADHGLSFGRRSAPSQVDLSFEDVTMSRRHARIVREGTAWKLEDLGSRNGGFVDGAPFAPSAVVPLRDGSVIRLGNTLIIFRSRQRSKLVDGEREAFPGASPAAAEVRRRLGLLATGGGHVLILGETGTGKERVARRIGRTDPKRPYIPKNCAELSYELARSELFGHVRGAFTGADVAKAGLIDEVRDGVLFLDEVGELPLDVQGELLRFLDDGGYRAVGATELRYSRARIVAATNVDLQNAVQRGTFRRDLLARLCSSNTPLVLPPLRERREDILGWARRFLDEACVIDLPQEIWTAGAAECLMLYPWTSNLRELRGVVRGLVETIPSWPIDPKLLPESIQAHRRCLREGPRGTDALAPAASPLVTAAPGESAAALKSAASTLTREDIERALFETEGKMRPASNLLGIDRRKLYRLCEQLHINIDSYRSGGRDVGSEDL